MLIFKIKERAVERAETLYFRNVIIYSRICPFQWFGFLGCIFIYKQYLKIKRIILCISAVIYVSVSELALQTLIHQVEKALCGRKSSF